MQQRARPATAGRRLLSRPRTAQSGAAEARAREQNLKLQLTLVRQLNRSERDRATWRRETEVRERFLLLEMARIMDSPLSPSVDDWFRRRRVTQVSLLPDHFDSRLYQSADREEAPSADNRGETPPADSATEAVRKSSLAATPLTASGTASTLSPAERQRILEAKRSDWLGLTSLPLRQRRPQTAAAGASAALNPGEGAESHESTKEAAASTADGPHRSSSSSFKRQLSRPQSARTMMLKMS